LKLVHDPALRGSHRVWSVRADLHRSLGDTAAALADYDRALNPVRNDVERWYLADARRRLIAGEQGERHRADIP
jgi:predicted RNA polymerase sigma factor